MKNAYNKTITACFLAYIVQAIINNFVPLLFLTFQSDYGIPLSQITLLVTFNFGIQLAVDLLSVGFVDRIGYRASMVLAHLLSGVGLLLLTVLPELLGFGGILFSVMVYAIGGGLLEVLVSPVVEACPSEHKEKAMSMLHSFYCWGHVGVVLLSTAFFHVFGVENWKILALVWAALPLLNGLTFTRVPMASLIKEGEQGLKIRQLFSMKTFWVLLLMMLCAGASEQAVSQWASAFAEKGLGISKTAGDLAGPMAFGVLMGLSRLFYGKYGDRIPLERFMGLSCTLCILAYLGISLFPIPQLSLVACAVCFVGRNPMAGHLQQCLCHAACRRNCHVCPAGSGWGCRLYPGAHPGGHGLRNRRRQPEAGNPGSCGISPDSVGMPGNFRETAA